MDDRTARHDAKARLVAAMDAGCRWDEAAATAGILVSRSTAYRLSLRAGCEGPSAFMYSARWIPRSLLRGGKRACFPSGEGKLKKGWRSPTKHLVRCRNERTPPQKAQCLGLGLSPGLFRQIPADRGDPRRRYGDSGRVLGYCRPLRDPVS